MRPTDEQIEKMLARGWVYVADGDRFVARSTCGRDNEYAISLRVWWLSGTMRPGWIADYGWSGLGLGTNARHPDPISAADECEAWLRGVLSGFRFPWLRVEG